MKRLSVLLALAVVLACGSAFAAPTTDVVQYSTGYFVPDEDSTYDSPYYRWYDEDWGWKHNPITGFSGNGSLYISAWDVDKSSGEIDNIYALDGANWVLLGSLNGLNDDWGYTTFNLSADFNDDIAAGLQVKIDIDSTHNYDNWAVTLAKSVITVEGGTIPDPDPNPVPEPATMLLIGFGLVGISMLKKKL